MNEMFRKVWKIGILVLLLTIIGCATYYQRNVKFQKYITKGEFNQANEWLEEESKDKKGRNEILFHLNKGYVYFMMKEHNKSNLHFQKAEQLMEDQQKDVKKEALALLLNPSVKDYKPEDFEIVMLHYFTALNYIELKKWEDALVECRRINIKLHELNDKYKDHKNRYQRDAFAHNLMGMIYEANFDYNNAFIAYRNAYQIYEDDYKQYFGLEAPEQLKKDLLRTAYLTGFYDEVDYYEKKFKMKYEHQKENNPELIFFWLTGFGPVKSQWEITFTKGAYNNGYVTYVNKQHGLSYRYYVGDRSNDVKEGFKNLEVFRVAFPKYVTRQPRYTSAQITCNQKQYVFQKVQDINQIAFKTLNDRMLRVFANSLLRVASKKAIQSVVNKQNENLGTVVSIANAITEKADTRNWQTLPYAIYYQRIPLKKGENNIQLEAKSLQGKKNKQHFTITAQQQGMIYFHYFHHLESTQPKM